MNSLRRTSSFSGARIRDPRGLAARPRRGWRAERQRRSGLGLAAGRQAADLRGRSTSPPTLPHDWILGDIRGLFVDDRDHLWVIHMPSSLTDREIGAAVKPPIADCCYPAPLVLELDPDGKVLRSWGGPGAGYTWYDQEHGIYIDHNGFVWTGTSNGYHVMKFTQNGKHVLTIGTPGVNNGSNDPDHLGGPANFYVEPATAYRCSGRTASI